MKTTPEFEGFPVAGLQLLTALPQMDAAAFKAEQARYKADLVAPAQAFVAALGARLQAEVSADIVALPRTNGSIAPINNDVRFAKGAPAYKDHLLFRFWEGANKKTAPTLFVRISAKDVGFASGVNFESLEKWRKAVDDPDRGAALAAAIAALRKGRKSVEIAGSGLKRVPAPYPADHPREALLRHKAIQVRWPEPTPKAIHGPAFVDFALKRLVACAPLHRWLVDSL